MHVLCTALRGVERQRVGAFFGYLLQRIILEVAGLPALPPILEKLSIILISKEFIFLVKVVAMLVETI